MDGSADGGAQVGRAESQETETIVVREWNPLLDLVDGVDQTGVDGLQVTTLLHRDDAQVILFVTPNQEGLVDVVVDTTTSWPVSASVGGLSIQSFVIIIVNQLMDILIKMIGCFTWRKRSPSLKRK